MLKPIIGGETGVQWARRRCSSAADAAVHSETTPIVSLFCSFLLTPPLCRRAIYHLHQKITI